MFNESIPAQATNASAAPSSTKSGSTATQTAEPEPLAEFLARIADLPEADKLTAARDRAEALSLIDLTPRRRQEERDALREHAGLKATDFAALVKPRPKGGHLRIVDGSGSADTEATILPIPGSGGLLLDLAGDRIAEQREDRLSTLLDWAPRLITWWTDPEGVPVYHVTVKGQDGYVLPETLRDGTGWDQFDHAAGHDVRKVREALAGAVKVQRRTVPRSPGLDSLGWHEINGQWVYVSADRCFGPSGEVAANVNVHSSDESALPEAPTGERLRDVVALSLSVLDVAVPRVSVPAMCSVWLAPLISMFGNDLPRFVSWMWSDGRAGVYGVLKSSLAAILQAHSGTGYRGESDLLPAADTTLPALSGILGERRDGLVIVDDYKPGETTAVDNKTQGTAEQAIRAATNRQKRAKNKMRSPGRAKVSACMALLMYTAECLPLFQSGSTHDRTFPFQVHKGDIRPDRLTVLQDRVDDFPEATAGYVAWLAANREAVCAFLTQRFRELRAELRASDVVTGRACSHIAHLLCAAEVFTRFAVEIGVMTEDERNARYTQIWDALIEAATAATTERAEDQQHEVWLRNLRSLFASGKLYAITPGSNGLEPPDQYADALGWGVERRDTLAGYVLPDGLGVVESEVNPAITRRDKSLIVGGVQLRRLLASHGIIRPVEHPDGKHDHLRRVRIGSSRRWLMVIPWEVFLGSEGGPEGGNGGPGGSGGGGPEGDNNDPRICNGYAFGKPCGLPLDPVWDDGNGRHANCVPAPAPAPAPSAPEATALPLPEAEPTPDEAPVPAPVTATSDKPVKRSAPSLVVPDGPHTEFLTAAIARKSVTTQQQLDALAERLAILDDPEIGKAPHRLRLLAAMEGTRDEAGPFTPYLRRRAPRWQPDRPAVIDAVRVMDGWNWERDFTGEVTVIDRNGSWPTAVSSVRVVHGQLEHTGPMEDITGAPRPGYYKVTVYPWTETDLPSPLGTEAVGEERWITGTRMHLLVDLAAQGRWPDASASDSWTGDPVRLSAWSHLIGECRRYALEIHGRESGAYSAVKEAFGQSMGLMYGSLDGDSTSMQRKWNCRSRRTDWVHAIKDQASATIWRTADKLRTLGAAPVSLRNVDELVLPAEGLDAATSGERPALRLDESGTTFGTWKIKDTEVWGDE